MEQKGPIAIVGGGISGLAAAYELEQAAAAMPGTCILLLEASGRLGGKVQSDTVGGLIFEQGPDSLLVRDGETRQLLQSLGLGASIVESSGLARRLYTVHRGKLFPVPDGLVMAAPMSLGSLLNSPLISALGKLRAAMEPFVPRRSDPGDESLAQFFTRRFGSEVARRLAVPLLASAYGGGSGEVSILATLPELRELERCHGSVLRGLRKRLRGAGEARPSFLTLREGLSALVDRLTRSLRATQVLIGRSVDQISLASHSGHLPRYRLLLRDGSSFDAEAVIVTTPAFVASRLLRSLSPSASQLLADIPYRHAIVVSLVFARGQLSHPLDGAGFVVPAEERGHLIACTWPLQRWPHLRHLGQDKAVFRCYVGGEQLDRLLLQSDESLQALVVEELARLVGVQGPPQAARVYRWPKALPTYLPGHLEHVGRLEQLLAGLPGIFLAGAAYRGAGVPDCIRQGRLAARAAVAFLTGARRHERP